MMASRDDPELVATVAAGDTSAYTELYRRHVTAALRIARHLATSSQDAEDLVSQAFANVLQEIRRANLPVQFRAYLFFVVRTGAYRLANQQRRCQVAGPRDDWEQRLGMPATGSDPTVGPEQEPIRSAFRSLPPRWRLVLWLSSIEGRSPKELGPLLDLNANGAAALTYRARQGLRRALTTAGSHHPSGAACE